MDSTRRVAPKMRSDMVVKNISGRGSKHADKAELAQV